MPNTAKVGYQAKLTASVPKRQRTGVVEDLPDLPLSINLGSVSLAPGGMSAARVGE